MATKNKDDWLTVRVGAELKRRIQDLVDSGEYKNKSEFTTQAIEEKLDPSTRDEVVKRELEGMKLRDPDFFRNLVK